MGKGAKRSAFSQPVMLSVSLPVGILVSGFPRFFGRVFRVFLNFSPNPARLNFMVFSASGSGFRFGLFQGISPAKAVAGFLQSFSRETFSSLCKGYHSPAGAGRPENSFGFAFFRFLCKGFAVFFLVAFEFFRANKSLKPTPNFYRDLFRGIGGAAYLHVVQTKIKF